TTRIEAFRRDRSPRAEDARQLARRLAQRAEQALTPALSQRERGRYPSPSGRRWREAPDEGEGQRQSSGALLASAYPDRIAIARGRRGEFLMANGRAAAARILLAAPLSLDDIERVAGGAIETAEELSFDRASASLRARRWRR